MIPASPDNASTSSLTKKKILQNPSHTSEKVISLVNPIDVSLLPRPKPKRLILKDPRTSSNKKLSRTQTSTSTINTMSSNEHDHSLPEGATPEDSDHKSLKSIPVPTIKAILEVPQRGYLRGELIPIKLSINHLRKIQDFNGIIITFVRVCRLDNGPDGVVESFRKDLQQLILPLYVDPVTFQSEINSSLRVPADAFPTIFGCPLVSFQYFVEVLINLSGKSIALDSDVDARAKANPQATKSSLDKFKFNFDSTQTERSTYINTDSYKRLKKFLQLTTEIYIGTHRLSTQEEQAPQAEEVASRRSSSMASNSNSSPAVFSTSSPHSPVEHQYAGAINSIPESVAVSNFTPPYENVVPLYVPPEFVSHLQNQSELSEKERMRQHESSLLPSAPPDDEQPSPVNMTSNQQPFSFFTYQNTNTSPPVPLDDDLYQEPVDSAPNYLNVNNDRLIVPQDNNSNSET